MSDVKPRWKEVLRAVKSGAQTSYHVALNTGMNIQGASRELRKLESRGRIRRVGVFVAGAHRPYIKWRLAKA